MNYLFIWLGCFPLLQLSLEVACVFSSGYILLMLNL